MTIRRHRLNLLWVACLAVVGMLSVGDRAKACAAVKVKACCAVKPMATCPCCGPEAPASRTGAGGSVERRTENRADSACECRPGVPATPAPKPDSGRSAERRADRCLDEVASYPARDLRTSRPTARLVRTDVCTSNTPLYLRMLHILV